MSTLRQAVSDYLTMRRTMGFKVEGLAKLLSSFVRYCEARAVNRVESDIAIAWATTMIKVPVSDALIARRMDAVRVFARHQHALDPATQIPPAQVIRRRYQPKQPNVFTNEEILSLLTAANTLTPWWKGMTWRTLIGLLATTGMRPGEACRLAVRDVDLPGGVIQVLATKFGKSRLVFIHPTTAMALGEYLKVRHDWVGTAVTACPALFVNTRRGPINPDKLSVTFNQIAAAAGITNEPGHRPPRLHDLRH